MKKIDWPSNEIFIKDYLELKSSRKMGNKYGCDKSSVFDYETTHKHDLMKNLWCKENNIPLIRIPYTHYNNLQIEDLLLETSNFLQ